MLPAGTSNLLARHLGIPLRLDQALEVSRRGARKQIDVGTAGAAVAKTADWIERPHHVT
jgi:diacylglycerol kinase family enzyme